MPGERGLLAFFMLGMQEEEPDVDDALRAGKYPGDRCSSILPCSALIMYIWSMSLGAAKCTICDSVFGWAGVLSFMDAGAVELQG